MTPELCAGSLIPAIDTAPGDLLLIGGEALEVEEVEPYPSIHTVWLQFTNGFGLMANDDWPFRLVQSFAEREPELEDSSE